MLIIAAASVPLVAQALGPVPNEFSKGDVISATKMNANFSHLQDAITAVEERVPACEDGQVLQRAGTDWGCVDVTALLSQKMAWGIAFYNPTGDSCTVEESSVAGVTCTFSSGAFTITIPGWNTHFANDVVTANASWCGSCSDLGIRVDPQSGNENILVVLTGYTAGTARVNFALIQQ